MVRRMKIGKEVDLSKGRHSDKGANKWTQSVSYQAAPPRVLSNLWNKVSSAHLFNKEEKNSQENTL